MRTRNIAALLAGAIMSTCGLPAAAEPAGAELSPTMRSRHRAAQILDDGIEALGGKERIEALGTVAVEYDGVRHMINQSRRAEAPWDREPSRGMILIDPANDRAYALSSNSYPGIGAFAASWAVKGNEGFHLDTLRNHHGNEVMKLAGPDADWVRSSNTRWVPPLLLLQAAANNTTLRWIDAFRRDGRAFEAISFVQPNRATPVLIFDADTRLLEGYEMVRADGVYGDVTDFVRFGGYRDVAGVLLPTTRTDYFNGEIARELSLAFDTGSPVDETLFRIPDGYVMPEDGMDEAAARIRKIGDGVYLDQDMGGVLIVEFGDFLLVADCPGDYSMSQSTMDAVREAIPGKTIRYLVSSHTHGDHCGGARAYFHAGTTLLTTPGHEKFYRTLARLRQTISPDPLAGWRGEPLIETFTGKKVISDGRQVVELYDVGPNAHSEEMVIAYLPRQKILWRADLLFIPYSGTEVNTALPITTEFAGKLKALGISNFEQIIDAHHSRVATAADFRATLERAGYREFP
jgi:glyoxylase-like metal-dependent hydrolase (beta-lactamase superfamily II)